MLICSPTNKMREYRVNNMMQNKLMTAVVVLAFLTFSHSQSQNDEIRLTTNAPDINSVTPFTDLTLKCSPTHPPGLLYEIYRESITLSTLQTGINDSMTLPSVGFKDSGRYACCGVPGYGCNMQPIFIAEVPTISTNDPIVAPHREMTLTCSVKSPVSSMTYMFYQDGNLTQSGPNLTMTLSEFNDTGNYTCRVKLAMGNVSLPSLATEIETPTLSTNGPLVAPYREVTLTCSVKSPVSNMTYMFYQDGKRAQSGPNTTMTLSEFKDTGAYTCGVQFANGVFSHQSSATKKLVISEIPTLTITPDANQIMPGDTVDMKCSVKTVTPSMVFSFYFKGKKLQSDKDDLLRLQSVEFEHSGDYTCDILYKGRMSPYSNKRVIFISACPIPTGGDDYTERLLGSITPKEETRWWGKRSTRDSLEESHEGPQDEL